MFIDLRHIRYFRLHWLSIVIHIKAINVWTCNVDFYESDSYNAMTSFTKKFLLQNDSEHSKNNFVHTSYKLVFSSGWKLTYLLILIHYTCICISGVFFKRQEHFNILRCWREIIQYFLWHEIHIIFFFYKMVTFITLPYLLLMLSSNFNINGCCFFIFYM